MAASSSNHHLAIAAPEIPEDLESLNDDNLLKNLDDKTVGFPVSHGWCWLAVGFWWENELFFLVKVVKRGPTAAYVVPCKTVLGWYVRSGHGVVSVLKR